MRSVIESRSRSKRKLAGTTDWTRLGLLKYGAALCASAPLVLMAGMFSRPWLIVVAIGAFYVVEIQMLFLFPVALDGSSTPFRASRTLMLKAGGTLRVLPTVLILAAAMLIGGLVHRAFVKYWALGCLAVILWYEQLAQNNEA